MVDKSIAKRWAMLALAILQTKDSKAMNPEWEAELQMFADMFEFSNKNAQGRKPYTVTYHPKADELKNDPEFLEFAKKNTTNKTAKKYHISRMTVDRILLDLGVTAPRVQKQKEKYFIALMKDKEFLSDIKTMSQDNLSKKYGIAQSTLSVYLRKYELDVQR